MSGDGQLRAFIERILRLKEEQDSLAVDIREVYAEAKGSGFDKTAMGQLVAHLRKIEKVGADAVEEGQTVFDMYLDAYRRATGTAIATHTHEASQSYAEAKDRRGNQSEANSSKASIAKSAEKEIDPSELTDTQEQPAHVDALSEVALPTTVEGTELSGLEGATGTGSAGGEGSTPSQASNSPSPANAPRLAADDEAAQANPIVVGALSNPQPISSPAIADEAEANSSPASAALSDAEIPAFLRKEEKKRLSETQGRSLQAQLRHAGSLLGL